MSPCASTGLEHSGGEGTPLLGRALLRWTAYLVCSAPAAVETDARRPPAQRVPAGTAALASHPSTSKPCAAVTQACGEPRETERWGARASREPPGRVSQAPAPGNAVLFTSGVPPEEHPDLTHRPRAGGGSQEVQLPVLTVAPPLPISGALPCFPGEPLSLHTLHPCWNAHVWGLLLHAPATTATAEWVIHF